MCLCHTRPEKKDDGETKKKNNQTVSHATFFGRAAKDKRQRFHSETQRYVTQKKSELFLLVLSRGYEGDTLHQRYQYRRKVAGSIPLLSKTAGRAGLTPASRGRCLLRVSSNRRSFSCLLCGFLQLWRHQLLLCLATSLAAI